MLQAHSLRNGLTRSNELSRLLWLLRKYPVLLLQPSRSIVATTAGAHGGPVPWHPMIVSAVVAEAGIPSRPLLYENGESYATMLWRLKGMGLWWLSTPDTGGSSFRILQGNMSIRME